MAARVTKTTVNYGSSPTVTNRILEAPGNSCQLMALIRLSTKSYTGIYSYLTKHCLASGSKISLKLIRVGVYGGFI